MWYNIIVHNTEGSEAVSGIVFIDTEVDTGTRKVLDYGAVNSLRDKLHTNSESEFTEFISGNKFICGHNIIAHDLKYILEAVEKSGAEFAVDTLYLSPLLFPQKPYHALLKDDKLNADELNNPLNDAIKAMQLFYDEVNAFEDLDEDTKDIFCGLLYGRKEFYGFFKYIDRTPKNDTEQIICKKFNGKICGNCDIEMFSRCYPIELAYCLALISTKDKYSVIPHWVHINFPNVENIMRTLRSTPCENGCGYCDKELTEFKNRLYELIGNAAAFVEIKTFHSYCFDLLGKIGSIENSKNVVSDAAQMIRDGEVELGKITKTVIVIDEAQDMDGSEFALIEALMERNEEMRVIAVGDDDQNIYEFRGSDSKYMRSFITENGAAKYELTENYRSRGSIVAFANAFAETITDRMKIEPITAVNDRDGELQLIRHRSYSLDEAVANHVIASYDGSGTACVLTSTNEEALRVTGLLQKRGQEAKLIQSSDGFDIYNIAEIRYFMKKIEAGLSSPVIGDSLWESSKNALCERYSQSDCLNLCLDLLGDFEKSTLKKYKTDLDMFIHESRLEDFYHAEKGTVLVSTIHKSKGREFDSVYMLLNNVSADTDEERRKLYVGITRARSGLYIHCNNGIFDGFEIPHCKRIIDENIYHAPNELTVQLTHRDVNLGFFKGKKNTVLNLRSGMKLIPTESGMGIETQGEVHEILRYSKDFSDKIIQSLGKKGYKPCGGEIRFIAAWKNKDDGEEYAVILPDVHFKK